MMDEEDSYSLKSKISPGSGTELGQSGNGNQLSMWQFFCFSVFQFIIIKLRVSAHSCIHPAAIGGTTLVSLKVVLSIVNDDQIISST